MEGDRSSQLIGKPQQSILEDFPEELMHLIQSYILDPKEAARTCILSKSWLHAWSTTPTLRFRQQLLSVRRTQPAYDHSMVVDRTLQRYLRDNIPFERIDLLIDINGDSVAERWIRPVATRACVKELSLTVNVYVEDPYTLPAEIFSSENTRKISIQSQTRTYDQNMLHCCCIGSNMVKCVSLRVLVLEYVNISEEVLDKLLSTCSLLEEVRLLGCNGSKTIKVKNLAYLRKFTLHPPGGHGLDNFEIYDVPNLSCFSYCAYPCRYFDSLALDDRSLASVTELWLLGVIIDKAFLEVIKSKFPLLQNLTLRLESWSSTESFHITCLPLKTFTLCFLRKCPNKVQVFAPKLRVFDLDVFEGETMPSLIFPAVPPEQIKVKICSIAHPIDGLFLVKIREALMLSSNFDILISASFAGPLTNTIAFEQDMRTRFPFPATNLQHLSLEVHPPEIGSSLPEYYSPFFDAFFSICHPKYVTIERGWSTREKSKICQQLIKEAMTQKQAAGWPHYLQGLEIKTRPNGKWETTPTQDSLKRNRRRHPVKFKLNWSSS